jgi:hypothetical protein
MRTCAVAYDLVPCDGTGALNCQGNSGLPDATAKPALIVPEG